jgi:hypothetical protein
MDHQRNTGRCMGIHSLLCIPTSNLSFYQDWRVLMFCMHENQHTWDEYDAQGIFLTRVCDKCVDAKLSQYRPEILSGYSQNDVIESIEEQ